MRREGTFEHRSSRTERARAVLRGAVQGVGFRPFIFRLAHDCGLTGWVENGAQGVRLEVEGSQEMVNEFLLRIKQEKPAPAIILSFEFSILEPVGYESFEIRSSDPSGEICALIMPDIATCDACLAEMFDPNNRRYRYPFINCTHCGPRYSIIESLPYDRANTSMKKFQMCPSCQQEYGDPANRRFHAQPNACPVCGPHVELWNGEGTPTAKKDDALKEAVEVVRSGNILALKGIGGFLLVVDARNAESVARLRQRKRREEKPFALMFPSLDAVSAVCEVSGAEERLLRSPEAPIVLLARKRRSVSEAVAGEVAPGNPYLGAMLPYAPLHQLLMRDLGFPVVATSGNLTDDLLCIDEHEALARLRGIADAFLVHDRPIVRRVDDSVARIVLGREQILRRSRGYAPLPIPVAMESNAPTLAVGGHLKNSIALSVGSQVIVSQMIGDLDSAETRAAFVRTIDDLSAMYGIHEPQLVCDLHPDYASTIYAEMKSPNPRRVQHHIAHIAGCMAENEINPPVLGVSWDGTGFGTDGTIWGGEFLLLRDHTVGRTAHLRQFRIPGGDTASKEPRRAALGVLFEVLGNAAFSQKEIPAVASFSREELSVVRRMLENGINSPLTSSAGRLFDAVSSLIGVCQRSTFEGQAAMELEYRIGGGHEDEMYSMAIRKRMDETAGGAGGVNENRMPYVLDWELMVLEILEDLSRKTARGVIAAKFHHTLSDAIVRMAERTGMHTVVLSGGCFQNKYLTERSVQLLRSAGFKPFWNQRIPPNDGGISAGQIASVAMGLDDGRSKRNANLASQGSSEKK